MTESLTDKVDELLEDVEELKNKIDEILSYTEPKNPKEVK